MSIEEKPIRAQRTSLMLMAQLYRHDRREPTAHRVLNLSETGVRVSGARELSEGAVVCVSIGQIDHEAADVVWVKGDSAGLRFRAPIDLAAARRKRSTALLPPAAGWLIELQNPYRR